MPQINQLDLVAYSQWFWLLLTLGLIYFGIGRAMLPKIQSTVDARQARITADLAGAEAARSEADAIEEGYRRRIDHGRGEAAKLVAAAKQQAALAAEQLAAEADAANQARLSEAEGRIRSASETARAEIAQLAADLTRDIVARVAGLTVGEDEAAAAVRMAVANG